MHRLLVCCLLKKVVSISGLVLTLLLNNGIYINLLIYLYIPMSNIIRDMEFTMNNVFLELGLNL